jgi:hypothetical protein
MAPFQELKRCTLKFLRRHFITNICKHKQKLRHLIGQTAVKLPIHVVSENQGKDHIRPICIFPQILKTPLPLYCLHVMVHTLWRAPLIGKTNFLIIIITSLVATMVRWFEGGVNQGLLPMTISDEESNLFCACHLLNCDEGQGQ